MQRGQSRSALALLLTAALATTASAQEAIDLSDEAIENGLLWVTDAVRESHLRTALGYQALQYFTEEVLPEAFWEGVKEHQEAGTEG